jgi:hypothetical protein
MPLLLKAPSEQGAAKRPDVFELGGCRSIGSSECVLLSGFTSAFGGFRKSRPNAFTLGDREDPDDRVPRAASLAR